MSVAVPRSRVLFQIRNRRGLGHLMRVQNVALALRRVAPDLDLQFHASSQPAHGLWDASLPLTSEQSITWVDRVSAFEPDVVVYDTVLPDDPLAGLDDETRIVFVMRRRVDDRVEEVLTNPVLDRVDTIIVPHTAAEFGQPLPAGVAARTHFVGSIARVPTADARPEIRRRYGLDRSTPLLTSTVGGGGFQSQADRFFELVEHIGRRATATLDDLHHVVVLGPNYANAERAEALAQLERTTVVAIEPAMADLLAASDLVVAEGGYNTVNEVRVSAVPALFVPSRRGLDDQRERVERLAAIGVARIASPDDQPDAIATTVVTLLTDPAALQAMRAAYDADDLVLGNDRAAELIAAVAR